MEFRNPQTEDFCFNLGPQECGPFFVELRLNHKSKRVQKYLNPFSLSYAILFFRF